MTAEPSKLEAIAQQVKETEKRIIDAVNAAVDRLNPQERKQTRGWNTGDHFLEGLLLGGALVFIALVWMK
jgi:hypothetical protein